MASELWRFSQHVRIFVPPPQRVAVMIATIGGRLCSAHARLGFHDLMMGRICPLLHHCEGARSCLKLFQSHSSQAHLHQNEPHLNIASSCSSSGELAVKRKSRKILTRPFRRCLLHCVHLLRTWWRRQKVGLRVSTQYTSAEGCPFRHTPY